MLQFYDEISKESDQVQTSYCCGNFFLLV